MTDNITLVGFVATVPKHLITGEGLPITSFRLASTQRRFDRSQGRWTDGETNWYTITAFRQLAMNTAGSISKGDRIVVTGRLRIRGWEVADRSGTNVDVEADAVGHDLSWGTSAFTRTIVTASSESSAAESEASDQATAGQTVTERTMTGQADAATVAGEGELGGRELDGGESAERAEEEAGFPPAAILHPDETDSVAVPF